MATRYGENRSILEPGGLKYILDNSHTPASLDCHPWTKSLVVQEFVARDPSLAAKSPGYQLVYALSILFKQMMPSTPPRRGKRLDTRWGHYGILAAQYFVPFTCGMAYPKSLRDALGRIDHSILALVFPGKSLDQIPREELLRYSIIGEDLNFMAVSTLSDWNRQGIERLTEAFLQRELFLSESWSKPSQILPDKKLPAQTSSRSNGLSGAAISLPRPHINLMPLRRYRTLIIVGFLLILFSLLGIKGWRVYGLVHAIRDDEVLFAGLSSDALYDPGQIKTTMLNLDRLQTHLLLLQSEIAPVSGICQHFGWIPVYGGDIASAGRVLRMANSLIYAVQASYRGALPLINAIDISQDPMPFSSFLDLLQGSEKDFENARRYLEDAKAARQQINASLLTPQIQTILTNKIDPLIMTLDDALRIERALPNLFGATRSGPKTYLILIENEDELRPTGGFITAAGTIVVKDGKLINYNIEDSGSNQEDLTKIYPAAPWQLQEYMNSSILVFRDSNWYVDFPTAAMWAEFLYTYTHALSADGVIALDQQMLALLLKATGPLNVSGVSYQVKSENVLAYLREAKILSVIADPGAVNRKAFLYDLADSLLKRINSGDYSIKDLIRELYQGLNNHDLLLQFDDTDLSAVMAEHAWDGAIRPGTGDFLMVVDSNVGFNKVNAVVDTTISYKVDLSSISDPQSSLSVVHHNNATKEVPCIQWDRGSTNPLFLQDKHYPIERCYWDYMRIYTLAGTTVLNASPQAIPAEWMILQKSVPARIDLLDQQDEQIEGIQGFGTMLVVPGGGTIETPITFSLPSRTIVKLPDLSYAYRLTIRKQPGTHHIPVHLQIKLPPGSKILYSSLAYHSGGPGLDFSFYLDSDISMEVRFIFP